jgi:flagellar biosynthesis/type III secretory pathway protein FliH
MTHNGVLRVVITVEETLAVMIQVVMISRDKIKKILREEDDFDWISKQNPATKEFIRTKLNRIYELRHDIDTTTEELYELALNEEIIVKLIETMKNTVNSTYNRAYDEGMQTGHEEGSHESYDRGYEEGYDDAESEYRYANDDALDEKYDEGYDEGREEGYEKGYSEGAEETYYSAFEEGRRYQSNMEEEEYERRQDPFSRDDEY